MFNTKLKLVNWASLFTLLLGLTIVSCDSKTDTLGDANLDSSEEESMDIEVIPTEAEKTSNEKTVYTIADVDMQPLFDGTCSQVDAPIECSNEKLLSFIKENTKFPKKAKFRGQDGFEQVIVVVEKDGSLSDLKYVASSQSKDCDGCQKAAVDVVGKMKNWVPGIKDGKPVAVQMTIPVKFKSS